jgi:hypothetical protein
MLPSQILAIVILMINVIVSHALWATDDAQCDMENDIVFNDKKLSNLYPRNVHCQSSNNTYCNIDFDNITGADEYYERLLRTMNRHTV